MKKKAERPVAKKAEAIYEATKVANFAASSLLWNSGVLFR